MSRSSANGSENSAKKHPPTKYGLSRAEKMAGTEILDNSYNYYNSFGGLHDVALRVALYRNRRVQ